MRSGRDRLTTSAASLAYCVMLVAFPAAVAAAADLLDVAQQGVQAAVAETPGWIALVTGFAFAACGLGRYEGGFTFAVASIRDIAQPDDYLRRCRVAGRAGVVKGMPEREEAHV